MGITRWQLIANPTCLPEAEEKWRQRGHGLKSRSGNHAAKVQLKSNVFRAQSCDETKARRIHNIIKRVDYFNFFFLGSGQDPKQKERLHGRTGGAVTSVHRNVSCSWWHEEGDERSTCGRSVFRSCTWRPRPSVKAR